LDQRHLERLFAEHAQGLFAMFAYRTGDPVLAEDLVADTFERIMCTQRAFDPLRGSEKSWVYAIAVNLLRDHARRRAVEQRSLAAVGPGFGDGMAVSLEDEVGRHDEIQRALCRLREDEREVLALRFGADLTLKEVARALGERPAAVEKRVYRALAKLREELE
jgi:RNA polymerase sigma-70 factor (ECF subfamily)